MTQRTMRKLRTLSAVEISRKRQNLRKMLRLCPNLILTLPVLQDKIQWFRRHYKLQLSQLHPYRRTNSKTLSLTPKIPLLCSPHPAQRLLQFQALEYQDQPKIDPTKTRRNLTIVTIASGDAFQPLKDTIHLDHLLQDNKYHNNQYNNHYNNNHYNNYYKTTMRCRCLVLKCWLLCSQICNNICQLLNRL